MFLGKLFKSQNLIPFFIEQLEDADFAKHMALKAKQQIENDMEELHNQIEAITRMKETVSLSVATQRCLNVHPALF